jgi:hypothetical protein
MQEYMEKEIGKQTDETEKFAQCLQINKKEKYLETKKATNSLKYCGVFAPCKNG